MNALISLLQEQKCYFFLYLVLLAVLRLLFSDGLRISQMTRIRERASDRKEILGQRKRFAYDFQIFEQGEEAS